MYPYTKVHTQLQQVKPCPIHARSIFVSYTATSHQWLITFLWSANTSLSSLPESTNCL